MRPQTIAFEPSDDSSLSGVTKVTVSGYISGCINENTQIRDIFGKDLHTSSIEALVGDPVNIETTGEFNSMTITFYYTDGLNENNLRIMWYDEENGESFYGRLLGLNRTAATIVRNSNKSDEKCFIVLLALDEIVSQQDRCTVL